LGHSILLYLIGSPNLNPFSFSQAQRLHFCQVLKLLIQNGSWIQFTFKQKVSQKLFIWLSNR